MFSLLFLFLSILFSLTLSTDTPNHQTIAYIPLPHPSSSSATPIPLVTLTYFASNASYSLSSYKAPTQSKLSATTRTPSHARLGILGPSKASLSSRSTTLTLLSTLADPERAIIRLALEPDGSVLSVGATPAGDLESASARQGSEKGLPRLEVVPAAPEPRALLNKPVQLNKEGKMVKDEEQGEKTLLARYWWVAALLLLVTMVGGGGGEEGGGERK